MTAMAVRGRCRSIGSIARRTMPCLESDGCADAAAAANPATHIAENSPMLLCRRLVRTTIAIIMLLSVLGRGSAASPTKVVGEGHGGLGIDNPSASLVPLLGLNGKEVMTAFPLEDGNDQCLLSSPFAAGESLDFTSINDGDDASASNDGYPGGGDDSVLPQDSNAICVNCHALIQIQVMIHGESKAVVPSGNPHLPFLGSHQWFVSLQGIDHDNAVIDHPLGIQCEHTLNEKCHRSPSLPNACQNGLGPFTCRSFAKLLVPYSSLLNTSTSDYQSGGYQVLEEVVVVASLTRQWNTSSSSARRVVDQWLVNVAVPTSHNRGSSSIAHGIVGKVKFRNPIYAVKLKDRVPFDAIMDSSQSGTHSGKQDWYHIGMACLVGLLGGIAVLAIASKFLINVDHVSTISGVHATPPRKSQSSWYSPQRSVRLFHDIIRHSGEETSPYAELCNVEQSSGISRRGIQDGTAVMSPSDVINSPLDDDIGSNVDFNNTIDASSLAMQQDDSAHEPSESSGGTHCEINSLQLKSTETSSPSHSNVGLDAETEDIHDTGAAFLSACEPSWSTASKLFEASDHNVSPSNDQRLSPARNLALNVETNNVYDTISAMHYLNNNIRDGIYAVQRSNSTSVTLPPSDGNISSLKVNMGLDTFNDTSAVMQLETYSPKSLPDDSVPLPHSNTLSMEGKSEQSESTCPGSNAGRSPVNDSIEAAVALLETYSPEYYPEDPAPLPHSNTLSMDEKSQYEQSDFAHEESEHRESNEANPCLESNTAEIESTFSNNDLEKIANEHQSGISNDHPELARSEASLGTTPKSISLSPEEKFDMKVKGANSADNDESNINNSQLPMNERLDLEQTVLCHELIGTTQDVEGEIQCLETCRGNSPQEEKSDLHHSHFSPHHKPEDGCEENQVKSGDIISSFGKNSYSETDSASNEDCGTNDPKPSEDRKDVNCCKDKEGKTNPGSPPKIERIVLNEKSTSFLPVTMEPSKDSVQPINMSQEGHGIKEQELQPSPKESTSHSISSSAVTSRTHNGKTTNKPATCNGKRSNPSVMKGCNLEHASNQKHANAKRQRRLSPKSLARVSVSPVPKESQHNSSQDRILARSVEDKENQLASADQIELNHGEDKFSLSHDDIDFSGNDSSSQRLTPLAVYTSAYNRALSVQKSSCPSPTSTVAATVHDFTVPARNTPTKEIRERPMPIRGNIAHKRLGVHKSSSTDARNQSGRASGFEQEPQDFSSNRPAGHRHGVKSRSRKMKRKIEKKLHAKMKKPDTHKPSSALCPLSQRMEEPSWQLSDDQ